MGPLDICPGNPRYLMNVATGRPIYLTGSHTWATLQERAYPETPEFDFGGWLDFMEGHGHNFLRLWTWEHAAWMQFTERMIRYRPNPYLRTGPGEALDGLPRFDLTRFEPGFFARMRDRVEQARDRGIYVSVMLFQGFSVEKKGGADDACGNPWHGHPFNRANNINGIDGDPDGDGQGRQVHTLDIPAITELQELYVRRVVDTVGGFDHVLFEIGNECVGESTDWQYHMIEFVRRCEAGAAMRHPVGMTFQYCARNPGTNADLFRSPADWVSPNAAAPDGYDYRDSPPPADGGKVVITDTDHYWGVPGDDGDPVRKWAWKSFLRGLNPIFMDPYRDARTGPELDRRWDPVRIAMGLTRRCAQDLDLARMVPHGELASSGYCLADPGRDYLVYLPEARPLTVQLGEGAYRCTWYEADGYAPGPRCDAAGPEAVFEPPFDDHCLLRITAAGCRPPAKGSTDG
jgi:hypothetical protein